MSILWFLVPAALALGLFFLLLFVLGAKRGQFEDLETPAYRILFDETKTPRREKLE